MRLDKLASQRQAEPERRIALPDPADAVEAGEHVLLMLGRDPLAVVGDRNRHILLVTPGGERDLALVGSVGDRIAKHMLERFAKPPRIADHHAGGFVDLDL